VRVGGDEEQAGEREGGEEGEEAGVPELVGIEASAVAVRRLRVRAAMSPTAARTPKVGSRR
jgi:hypothetical protein